MSDQPPISLTLLANSLRGLGYEIEPGHPGEALGASLVARQDRGDRVVVLVLDASGRFRIDLTWTIGEWSAREELAAMPVRVVDTVSRSTNITGQLEFTEDILEVVAALGGIVDWASPTRMDGSSTDLTVPPP